MSDPIDRLNQEVAKVELFLEGKRQQVANLWTGLVARLCHRIWARGLVCISVSGVSSMNQHLSNLEWWDAFIGSWWFEGRAGLRRS